MIVRSNLGLRSLALPAYFGRVLIPPLWVMVSGRKKALDPYEG